MKNQPNKAAVKDETDKVYFDHQLDCHQYTIYNAMIYVNRMIKFSKRESDMDKAKHWEAVKTELEKRA